MEDYRRIVGSFNYDVSDQGNIQNNKTGRVLKQFHDGNGYKIVNISINGRTCTRSVHRLVAHSFIPNLENKPNVDHIDGNKSNNNVSNLRWCNQAENCRNTKLGIRNTSGIKGVYFNKKLIKWCAQITVNQVTTYIGTYLTINEAKLARRRKATQMFGAFINKCEA